MCSIFLVHIKRKEIKQDKTHFSHILMYVMEALGNIVAILTSFKSHLSQYLHSCRNYKSIFRKMSFVNESPYTGASRQTSFFNGYLAIEVLSKKNYNSPDKTRYMGIHFHDSKVAKTCTKNTCNRTSIRLRIIDGDCQYC